MMRKKLKTNAEFAMVGLKALLDETKIKYL